MNERFRPSTDLNLNVRMVGFTKEFQKIKKENIRKVFFLLGLNSVSKVHFLYFFL